MKKANREKSGTLDIHQYISTDPGICHGKPCFKGSRVMVSTILELLEAGETPDEIREGYPAVTPQHIKAALHLAAQAVENTNFTL